MTESQHEVLEGPGVRLRPYREEDIPDVARACNDPDTRRYLHNLPDPYRIEDATWWVMVGAPAGWAAGGAQYVIADPVTDRLTGSIGLSYPSRERRQAELGYWVAPTARGKGLATAATRTLAAWAHQRGFSRLELLCEPENVPSQRVALAAGFRYEGTRRGAGLDRRGVRHDLTAWSRLASDPPGPAPRPLPDLPGGALSDGTVLLRPLRAADADAAYRHRTAPDVVASSVPAVLPDRDAVVDRCARAQSRWLAGERADLAIVDAADGGYAGEIDLYYQDPVAGQAMIGYSVAPDHRGRGFATRAARLVVRWAFGQVGLARLIAGVAPDNHASQRVLEKAGFRFEAYQRARLPGPGAGRADDLLYVLLPGDLVATADAPAG